MSLMTKRLNFLLCEIRFGQMASQLSYDKMKLSKYIEGNVFGVGFLLLKLTVFLGFMYYFFSYFLA